MKSTRQRCQLAPESTVESALRSLSWASEITSSRHVAHAWQTYIQLTQAEAAPIRPVWHQKTDRGQAHILACFVA